MKLLTKQFLTFFVGSIFTLAVAGTAIWGFKDLERVTDQLLLVDIKINALANDFSREIAKSRRAEKEFFIFPNKRAKQVKYIANWHKSYDLIMAEYLEELDLLLGKNKDREKLVMTARARELMNANIAGWKDVTDKFKRTKSYNSVNKAEYGLFKKRTNEIEDISAKLIDESMNDVFESRQKLQTERALTENLIKGIFIAALLWGLLAPIFFARRLTDAIKNITKVTEEISRGRLGINLKVTRKDELGDLAAAINRMQRSLMIMIKKIKGA
ncbi:MAG: HAMP domain-containing protein [Thermodesulfobacteriota bacterium]